MIFMTTDKSVKEDYIEEKNAASSVAYKMASHMAASAPVLVGSLSAEEKLIRSIVTDDKLSDKEKISKLKKYKSRLKAGKTYRENRGNFIPGVDKAIKHKVYDKLFKDVDDAIKELGGTVEEAVEDINLEGKELEEILNIIEEETILQEKNDGKDAEYVDNINKIMKKVESSNLKDISKSDLVELDKNIKAIKDNHKKADIILLVLVGLSGGLVGAFAAPLYPAVLATILYIETLINFGVIENKNADPEMSRVAHNIHRAFIINSEKIDKLNKLENPSYKEIETLKELKKYNLKLAGLDQKLKRANYFNMKESAEEVKDEKHYLYESINLKSLNEIIM